MQVVLEQTLVPIGYETTGQAARHATWTLDSWLLNAHYGGMSVNLARDGHAGKGGASADGHTLESAIQADSTESFPLRGRERLVGAEDDLVLEIVGQWGSNSDSAWTPSSRSTLEVLRISRMPLGEK